MPDPQDTDKKIRWTQANSSGRTGEIWASDVAVLPTSETGNKYLIVFAEYLTKWVITAALPSFDTNSIAQVLLYEVVLKHGVPRRFITDNGTNYISQAMQAVCQRLGITKSNTSVEHPQSDGLVKRLNRTIKGALAIYVEQTPTLWDQYLPFVTFAINTSKQASTGKSPFELMYGRMATLPTTTALKVSDSSQHNTKTWIAYLNHYIPLLHQEARNNIQKAQERQKKYYDRGRMQRPAFQINDLVLRIKPKETWKFPQPKFSGPWKVSKVNNKMGTSYTLVSTNDKRTRTTNANVLQLYKYHKDLPFQEGE